MRTYCKGKFYDYTLGRDRSKIFGSLSKVQVAKQHKRWNKNTKPKIDFDISPKFANALNKNPQVKKNFENLALTPDGSEKAVLPRRSPSGFAPTRPYDGPPSPSKSVRRASEPVEMTRDGLGGPSYGLRRAWKPIVRAVRAAQGGCDFLAFDTFTL